MPGVLIWTQSLGLQRGGYSGTRVGSEIAEAARKSGYMPLVWIGGILILIAVAAFLIKMRRDS